MRSGLIAQKLGMTRIFKDDGTHVPVTVLALQELPGRGPAHCRTRTATSRCSSAPAPVKVKNVTKAERGQFAVAKVEPKRKIVEFRVTQTT